MAREWYIGVFYLYLPHKLSNPGEYEPNFLHLQDESVRDFPSVPLARHYVLGEHGAVGAGGGVCLREQE